MSARLLLKQIICGLHGHDHVWHFERTRVSLWCVGCGHQTRGWTDIGQVPRRTVAIQCALPPISGVITIGRLS